MSEIIDKEEPTIHKNIDYLLILLILSFFVIFFIIVNFIPLSLPKIEKNVFEQIIMLNVTILGFTILGIFHYLSKFDDYKKNQLDIFIEIIRTPDLNGIRNQNELRNTFEGLVRDMHSLFEILDSIIKSYAEFFVILIATNDEVRA